MKNKVIETKVFKLKTMRAVSDDGTVMAADQHRWSEMVVPLSDNDTDIFIHLPNGEEYIFQYRCEHQSVDLCIGKNAQPLLKTCYLEDGNMRPGKKLKGHPAHCRKAAQIVII